MVEMLKDFYGGYVNNFIIIFILKRSLSLSLSLYIYIYINKLIKILFEKNLYNVGDLLEIEDEICYVSICYYCIHV